MSLKKATNMHQFPVQDQQRATTDLFCAFVGVAFTLVILILCFILGNTDHVIKTSFPSDTQGRVCGFDLPQYPYLYFTTVPQIQKRVCVAKCPYASDTTLQCMPTDNISCSFNNDKNFHVGYYPNAAETTLIGSFCIPTDESTREALYTALNVSDRIQFIHSLATVGICALVALALGILYTIAVQNAPKLMNKVTLIAGCVILLVTVIFILAFPTTQLAARIIFALILLLLLATVYFTLRNNTESLVVHGKLLNYATQVVSQHKFLLAYIPLFMAVFALFLLILGFELKCLWSSAAISFTSDEAYYQFKPGQTTFWTVLVFIQAVWGLSFIKEAFNFCISANSAKWYYLQLPEDSPPHHLLAPLKTLVCSHLGSVVAGSFLTGWFSLFDYLFDCLRSDTPATTEQQDQPSCWTRCVRRTDQMFDLVRSDCMGYIYLTSNPYCNSARYCEFLCQDTPLTKNSQSTSRAYRICAHFLLAGLAASVSVLIQGRQTSVYIVLVVFLLSLFISTFFISLHADAAEAMQVIMLMDYHFASKQLSADHTQSEVLDKMQLRRQFIKDIFADLDAEKVPQNN